MYQVISGLTSTPPEACFAGASEPSRWAVQFHSIKEYPIEV
jgi:hypothetical protein